MPTSEYLQGKSTGMVTVGNSYSHYWYPISPVKNYEWIRMNNVSSSVTIVDFVHVIPHQSTQMWR